MKQNRTSGIARDTDRRIRSMARHRIVCTLQEPANNPPHSAHIVSVGIGDDPNRASSRQTVSEVIAAMNRGEVYYTRGLTSGKEARVLPHSCPSCKRQTLRSAPDAVKDNNLDNLRYCNWSS
jgi:hypothetical protein